MHQHTCTCFHTVFRYVYERLAGKRRPGFRELMITQLVNAMWHGLAPRYIAFFVHSVFFIQFSSVVSRLEGLLPEAAAKSYPWRGLKVSGLLCGSLAATNNASRPEHVEDWRVSGKNDAVKPKHTGIATAPVQKNT